MTDPTTLPGFLACPKDLLSALGESGAIRSSSGSIDLWSWRLEPVQVPQQTLLFSRAARATSGELSASEVAEAMAKDPTSLMRLLPPFGAVAAIGRGVTAVVDSMGFQHVFHTLEDAAVPVLSNVCLEAGRSISAPLDETAVAVQSLLGWQLGQRTILAGIRKLEPGARATLDRDQVRVSVPAPTAVEPIGLDQAVQEAAALLRTSLSALLDDQPQAVLQLTGGMDSRLLLSAIPERRRRGLRAMTLEVPGSGDVAIAEAIARRYGIQHDVHGLADVHKVDPEEAWELCRSASVRLDAMSDPVALAAQRVAERAFDQGVRISGLGGEIARGFYYVGKVKERSYDRADAERLASWRMFVNEAVEPGLLTGGFAEWARGVAHREVHQALLQGGPEWFRAADDLYVRHRMQRWAGATDVAVSDQRMVINPMLDPGFLNIAARLSPRDKAGSRFLGALQMELDPELGALPLEGRPSPAVYASPPRWQPALDAVSLARRAARKAAQRFQKGNRPPAGGAIMTAKVVDYWRRRPETLETVASLEFVSEQWVEAVLRGQVAPRPSSVAFLTNLVTATSLQTH